MAPEIAFDVGGERRTYPLDKDEIRIGRAPENDLVVQDGSISRYHARIHRAGTQWRIEDLGSKNGTHVNDLSSPTGTLRDGDEILLGTFAIKFLDESSRVALTVENNSSMDESSGSIFRVATDFSELAGRSGAPVRGVSEAERLRKLLKIVTEASAALLAARPLDETLTKVLDLVFEHLPVERGCIMLWDEKRQSLLPRVKRMRDPNTTAEITISRTIAEKVYRDKVAVLTTDAQQDARFSGGASILLLGIRSAMAAPIWNGDRVEGIVYCDTPFHVKAFDDFDLDLLSAVGNHAAIAIEQWRLQQSILNAQLSRQRLERYHSPAVIERISRGGDDVESLAADERDVTVLFADAVGFTDRCERTEPRAVAALLNRYFSRMADMVFKHEGTLDKFIGDCLMAVFGAPLETEDHALRAVMAALDMREALRDLNDEMPEEDRVEFRVGMHSGRVIAGDIGSARRSDYTVLGATVNLAARLQSAVSKPGQIIISDATHDALGGRFTVRVVGEFQPKGISRMVKCYEVLGRAD